MDYLKDFETSIPPANPPEQHSAPAMQEVEVSIDNPSTTKPSPSPSSPSPPIEEQTGITRFFKLKYYEQYFKVSEMEVIERAKLMLVPPFSDVFVEKVRPTADFYGPFWVLATVVFLLGIAGNLSNYLHYQLSDGQISDYYPFRLELIRYAIVLIGTLGALVPVSLYFAMKFFDCPTLSFPQLLCMYGYSLTCYIPALTLCIIPFGWLIWLILLYAFANSTVVMIMALGKWVQDAAGKKFVLFAIIGIANFILFLLARLLFFHFDEVVAQAEVIPV